jgi:hypothetical protein
LLDFIIELPLSIYIEYIYNSILIVIDRFSKIARYILTNNNTNIVDIATLFINNIILKFSIPRLVVSNRGLVFILSF